MDGNQLKKQISDLMDQAVVLMTNEIVSHLKNKSDEAGYEVSVKFDEARPCGVYDGRVLALSEAYVENDQLVLLDDGGFYVNPEDFENQYDLLSSVHTLIFGSDGTRQQEQ